LRWTVSRSYVANPASQIVGDQLSFCFRWRHPGRESPRLAGKIFSALSHQNVTNCKPPALYFLSRLKESSLALLDSEVSLQ
jgi:hypothetical protein